MRGAEPIPGTDAIFPSGSPDELRGHPMPTGVASVADDLTDSLSADDLEWLRSVFGDPDLPDAIKRAYAADLRADTARADALATWMAAAASLPGA